ncbi:MAG TPA: GNAT family N-acetyltransferase [Polyangiaceae bacterium]|jgi:CelD/BcsL family acetyltransferase involved in cellulose biosynthesis|nr:GNAT family N-acetyltransferase [Polyangiaceae bacterium]
MLSVETVSSLGELLPLEPEWRRLEACSGLPFSSWDWTLAWWAQLRENKLGIKDSLFVCVIRTEQGQLVSVAPMLVSRRPSIGPICIRQLQFLGADPNITEVRGLLALPEWRADAYRALLRHAYNHAEQWDSMLLSGVPAEFEDYELARFAKFEWTSQTRDYLLPLSGSWQELRAGLPRNIKESLRKCYNSLKREDRQFRLETVERADQVNEALTRFFAFHGARAELSDTVPHGNVFDTPEAQLFLNDVCMRFAERGCLRIFQLRVDEQVVAIRIGFIVGDSLYLYYSGYDPEFARYSVMTTTVAEAIQYAILHGMKSVNLSTGNDVSKTRWNPVEVVTRQALLVSPCWRAELARDVYRHAVGAVQELPALRLAMRFLTRRSTTQPRIRA